MIVMFLHESAVARRLCSELHCSRRCPVTSNIYKIPADPRGTAPPVILRIPRIESHRPRHAVGLSWKTRSSQLVLAAVRPLLARSARPRPEDSSHLPSFANPASRKKTILERSIDRKRVYTPAVERPNTRSGQRRREAMPSHGSWSL